MYLKVHIRINSDYPVPVQVDGEPWLQPPCQITIIRSALKVKRKIFLIIGNNLKKIFRQRCFENVNLKSNVEIQSQLSIFLNQMMTQDVETLFFLVSAGLRYKTIYVYELYISPKNNSSHLIFFFFSSLFFCIEHIGDARVSSHILLLAFFLCVKKNKNRDYYYLKNMRVHNNDT